MSVPRQPYALTFNVGEREREGRGRRIDLSQRETAWLLLALLGCLGVPTSWSRPVLSCHVLGREHTDGLA